MRRGKKLLNTMVKDQEISNSVKTGAWVFMGLGAGGLTILDFASNPSGALFFGALGLGLTMLCAYKVGKVIIKAAATNEEAAAPLQLPTVPCKPMDARSFSSQHDSSQDVHMAGSKTAGAGARTEQEEGEGEGARLHH